MVIDYCGHGLPQWFGWASPACLKKEGATSHPGACQHSLQYDRRPDGRLGVRVGMWNLGSLSGRGEKFMKN